METLEAKRAKLGFKKIETSAENRQKTKKSKPRKLKEGDFVEFKRGKEGRKFNTSGIYACYLLPFNSFQSKT